MSGNGRPMNFKPIQDLPWIPTRNTQSLGLAHTRFCAAVAGRLRRCSYAIRGEIFTRLTGATFGPDFAPARNNRQHENTTRYAGAVNPQQRQQNYRPALGGYAEKV